MTAGLVACLAALVVATAIGLAWRATNGRMRAPRQPGAGSARARTGGEPAGGLPVDSATADLTSADAATAAAAGPRVSPSEIGQPLGERATLLQFSSAFCAPCRATRRILSEVAGMTEGVAHVEIDAESRLDLVRELGILRTPTVLVLAADGRDRAPGQRTAAQGRCDRRPGRGGRVRSA